MRDREERVLRAIHSYSCEHQVAPAVRDVASLLGYHTNCSVHDAIRILENNGYLEAVRVKGVRVARGLIISRAGKQALGLSDA